MALILPVLPFLFLVPVIRRGQSEAAHQAGGWELAALLSAALCGAAVTLSLEALTLFQAIRAKTVTLVWLLLDVAVAAWLLARLRWNPLRRQTARVHLAWDEWLFASLLALLLGGLLAVAWDASGIAVISEERWTLEDDRAAAIGDRYLVLSGDGDLALLSEIAHTVRPAPLEY